jgi:hypothetical protein
VPYSRNGMVEQAHLAGYRTSARLVSDWADLGLLDHPARVANPNGRGAYYVWSDIQRDLFVTLLAKRGGVKAVASLATIPVSVWVYWGDEWIRLSQVRRALGTWVGEVGKQRSRERACAHAQTIVRSLVAREGQMTNGQRALRDALADALFTGMFARDAIEPLVRSVLLEANERGRWGPFQYTEVELVDELEVMHLAVDNLADFTEGDFHEARARQRQTLLQYAREQPRLAAAFGGSFEDPNLEMILNGACRHLLENLGGRILADRRGITLDPITIANWRHPPAELRRMPPANRE